MDPQPSANSLRRQRYSISKRNQPLKEIELQVEPGNTEGSDSDDDLEVDLAKAALSTGNIAFEAQQWAEAESLLQEALRAMGQLPHNRRGFCDMFDLHFRLSVCTYYTQAPLIAEEALTSLNQHSLTTDIHQARMCEATHLLAQLYIRMGRIDLAKVECEKTLQSRRRLLGKRSDASLQSMALMAHIYVLLDNRALAKAYLAMIPQEKRDLILHQIGISLGTNMAHLEFSTIMQPHNVEDYSNPTQSSLNEHAAPSLCYGLSQNRFEQSPTTTHSPAPSRSSIATSASSPQFWPPKLAAVHKEIESDVRRQVWTTPPSSNFETFDAAPPTRERSGSGHATVVSPPAMEPRRSNETAQSDKASLSKPLSRKDILHKVRCQPRDDVEEAVCQGDHTALNRLLDKKKGFWRSSLRRNVRSERVTALHFAALFGEVAMARRLIAANYSVNEIPFGYSTRLTPLHFAIGARQASMVQFLIANGARPQEPDTWSTLASQLMIRDWMVKTMSVADRDFVAESMVAILNILLNAGWQINTPFGAAGGTILHQAVALWTGSYRLDMELRVVVTRFLCTRGADPLRKNCEGKTPWNIAASEDHQDLLKIMEQGINGRNEEDYESEPVELPTDFY